MEWRDFRLVIWFCLIYLHKALVQSGWHVLFETFALSLAGLRLWRRTVFSPILQPPVWLIFIHRCTNMTRTRKHTWALIADNAGPTRHAHTHTTPVLLYFCNMWSHNMQQWKMFSSHQMNVSQKRDPGWLGCSHHTDVCSGFQFGWNHDLKKGDFMIGSSWLSRS